MGVAQVTSTSELDKTLSDAGSKLVVVDLFATWCGPCHAIAPFIEQCATKYADKAVFIKVDVDKDSSVASKIARVSSIPTFIFIKNGQNVDQVRGADKAGIERTIQKHLNGGGGGANSGGPSFTGRGQRLGGDDSTSSSTNNNNNNNNSINNPLNDVISTVSNMEPQVKVGIALVVLYLSALWFG